MTYLVSYPMYDLSAPMRDAFYQWWSLIEAQLKQRHAIDIEVITDYQSLDNHWKHPNLLLSQTCGFPFVQGVDEYSRIIATPQYRVAGYQQSNYCSAYITQRSNSAIQLDHFKNQRFVYNGENSQSGYNIIRYDLLNENDEMHDFFALMQSSGSHKNSLDALIKNEADIASIDCVTWAILSALYPPFKQQLKCVQWSTKAPGLPFISSKSIDKEIQQDLTKLIFESLSNEQCKPFLEILLIDNFHQTRPDDYQIIKNMFQRCNPC